MGVRVGLLPVQISLAMVAGRCSAAHSLIDQFWPMRLRKDWYEEVRGWRFVSAPAEPSAWTSAACAGTHVRCFQRQHQGCPAPPG